MLLEEESERLKLWELNSDWKDQFSRARCQEDSEEGVSSRISLLLRSLFQASLYRS